jgi:predicted RNA-binding protein associated with RNAse of E/G family
VTDELPPLDRERALCRLSSAVREGGITAEQVQVAVRIAATVNAAAAKTPKSPLGWWRFLPCTRKTRDSSSQTMIGAAP